jgi:SAM-dependent methyltransferase
MSVSSYVVERAKGLARRFTERERTRTQLARQYLVGEGIEIGALRMSRADLRRQYRELNALPIVDPDIIDDGETLCAVAPVSLDFVIANHFIEHCADPIGTIRVFASKLRAEGVIYMAVPDKRFCFDKQRPSTSFEHLEADHEDGGAASRVAHFVEFIRFSHFHGQASEEDVQTAAQRALGDNYSIHYHCWTFNEFGDFLRRLMATQLPELELVDSKLNRDEGIFILRRRAAP